VPAAVKHQRELGDDLQVIFVECQGADRDTYEAFAWKMKWMGNSAMWTDERPFATTGSGLPETALIGVDGTLIMQGHPGMLGKKLTEALEAEIEKSKKPPESAPAELKKAWTLFHKGDVAAAMAECEKVQHEQSESTKAEFESRTTARLQRASRMIDEGHLFEAEKQLAALEKSVKAHAELAAKVAEQSARLSAPDMAREREASKAVSALLDKLATEKPFDDGSVKKVNALAEKYKGTKSGERAARFVQLSKLKIGG
jgi:hypothetical protein